MYKVHWLKEPTNQPGLLGTTYASLIILITFHVSHHIKEMKKVKKIRHHHTNNLNRPRSDLHQSRF